MNEHSERMKDSGTKIMNKQTERMKENGTKRMNERTERMKKVEPNCNNKMFRKLCIDIYLWQQKRTL